MIIIKITLCLSEDLKKNDDDIVTACNGTHRLIFFLLLNAHTLLNTNNEASCSFYYLLHIKLVPQNESFKIC